MMLPSGSRAQEARRSPIDGDPVLRLQVGEVVLLEGDSAFAKAGDDRVEILDAESGHRTAALACGHALVNDQ